MTPTEQDSELREQIADIFDELCEPTNKFWHRDSGLYWASKVMQLITADRKRVALEARISELKMWELPENEIQMVFANPCNICGHDYPKLRKAQQDRLSALKAQQEEV